jgi:hypothetical protein
MPGCSYVVAGALPLTEPPGPPLSRTCWPTGGAYAAAQAPALLNIAAQRRSPQARTWTARADPRWPPRPLAAHRGADGRRHRSPARRGRDARARDRHHRAAQRAGGRHHDRGDRRPVSARLQPANPLPGSQPQAAETAGGQRGRCRSPRPPPCPYSRRSPSSISSSPSIRRMPGTTRLRRGPGWQWNARGPPPRWGWPSSCCAGETHEPDGPGCSAALSAGRTLRASRV